MRGYDERSEIKEHAMYYAVRTETLKRWLEHAVAFDLKEIAAEISAELAIRGKSANAPGAGLDL